MTEPPATGRRPAGPRAPLPAQGAGWDRIAAQGGAVLRAPSAAARPRLRRRPIRPGGGVRPSARRTRSGLVPPMG